MTTATHPSPDVPANVPDTTAATPAPSQSNRGHDAGTGTESTGRKLRLRAKPSAAMVAAATPLLAIIVFALLYPLSGSYDPYGVDLTRALLAPLSDGAHPLGTDALGRDSLSRIVRGTQVTLFIAFIVIAVNLIIGVVLGTLAGYFRGPLDSFVMALGDVHLAMPVVLLLIAVSAVFGPSTQLLIIVLALTFWVGQARVARTTTMKLAAQDFVIAPRLQGAGAGWTIFRHILPQLLPQAILIAVSEFSAIILIQSSMDYLGVGVQLPTPSLGGLIYEGQKFLRIEPWVTVLPGLLLLVIVACLQFITYAKKR